MSKNTSDYEILKRTLHFYRAANIIDSPAREVALISACAGVEAITSYVLSERGGWSKNLLSKAALSDKIRATVSLLSMNDYIFKHCKKLQAKKKVVPNLDELELLTMFRNKIIHSDKDFSYTGLELLEAFNVFQWLIEMFIFSIIGYRGSMSDRRKMTGYPEIAPVPINDGLPL